jgi:O-antigen/teichoic acid export membrane protein
MAFTTFTIFIFIFRKYRQIKRRTPTKGTAMTNSKTTYIRLFIFPLNNRVKKTIGYIQPIIKPIIIGRFISSYIDNNISPASDNASHPLNKMHERQANSIEKITLLI